MSYKAYLSEILDPWEEECSRCAGSGWVTHYGEPWLEEEAPHHQFVYESMVSKCGDCNGEGLKPNEEGEALLKFLHKYLKMDVFAGWQ